MDKVEQYKQLIKEEMEYQASIKIANIPDVPARLFIGENNQFFTLYFIGWQDKTTSIIIYSI